MESATARAFSPDPVAFEDGLGQRRVTLNASGETVEVLTVREDLTANPSFEPALRDRVKRMSEFRSEHYARVHDVERVGRGASQLALVSEHIPGVRLSEILAVAERELLPVETNAALCLTRQLVHAIAVLHDKVPESCHGTIGPERIVITPQARLVVVEHVLGSAVEQLRYSNKQYWQDLRVPLPRTFGMPHFDRRTDVTQVGATTLALIIGRPLADDEFPSQVSDMTDSALALLPDGGLEPLPLALRVWLQRALQIDSRTPFSSALEAWAELDRVLHYSDPIAELESLRVFLARYHAAPGTQSAASVSTPATPVAPVAASLRPVAPPAPVVAPVVPVASAAPVAPSPVTTTMSTTNSPVSTPLSVPKFSAPPVAPAPSVSPAAATPPAAPEAEATPAMPISASGFWDRPVAREAEESPAAAASTPRQSVSVHSYSRVRLGVAAVLLIALTAGLTLGARQFLTQPVAADGMGTLVVQTNPSGATVSIDGDNRGVTPMSLDLTPGRHTLKLSSEGNVRSMPITITAGGQVSQFIELPRASSVLGELQVRTDPAGAKVTVDGHPYGKAPLTVEGLSPGIHTVVLENDLGSMTQEVKIEAGTTASLVVPLNAPKNAPVSGWISVVAPADLQIFEDSRLLGTSQTERIMVSVGRHELQMVNEAIGYRETQVVTVAPGRVSALKPRWPTGAMSFNAVPWAEVWVDGQQIGETPLGNVAVPIGPHEVVFRHPELGEKRVRSVVTLGTPAKVSVDLRQR